MTDRQSKKPSDGDDQPGTGGKTGLEGDEKVRTTRKPSNGDTDTPPTTKTGLGGKE